MQKWQGRQGKIRYSLQEEVQFYADPQARFLLRLATRIAAGLFVATRNPLCNTSFMRNLHFALVRLCPVKPEQVGELFSNG